MKTRRAFLTSCATAALSIALPVALNDVVPLADIVVDGKILTLFGPRPNIIFGAVFWWGLRGAHIPRACLDEDCTIVKMYDQSGHGNDVYGTHDFRIAP